ncbi:hypothetical protein D3C87_1870840 [compost metagenome]
MAVYVHFEIGLYAVEFNQRLTRAPAFTKHEYALIGAGRIRTRNEWHVNREGEAFIGVLQFAVAF